MAVLAAGWEAECWDVTSGSVSFTSSSDVIDTTYSDRGFQLSGSGATIVTMSTSGASTTIWVHMRGNFASVASGNTWVLLQNGTTNQMRLQVTGTNQFTFQKTTDGTNWTTVGAAFTSALVAAGTVRTYDIQFVMNASTGAVALYVDTTLIYSATSQNTTTQATQANRVSLYAPGGGTATYAEWIVADESTLGWRLEVLRPNATGQYAEWSGAFTDVNEIGASNDSNSISSNTANQRAMYNYTDPDGSTSSRIIKGFVQASRSSATSGSTPTDLQHGLRISTTDYWSSSLGQSKDGVIRQFQTVWSTNPATSSAWAQSDFTNIQAGVRVV